MKKTKSTTHEKHILVSTRFSRALSLLLTLAVLFCSYTFIATAQQADITQTEESPISATQSDGKFLNEISFEGTGEYIYAVYELNDRREENVKHFSMPDGTYRAVVYGEAVHRLDADGKWADIDNSLNLTKKNGMSLYSDAEGRISFAGSAQPSAQGSFLFSLTENGYLLAMALKGNTNGSGSINSGSITATASVAAVTNPAAKEALTPEDSAELQFEKLSAVDNQTDIFYADILSGTDLEYTLRSNSIKENIVVKSPQASYVYSFEVATKGLTAALSDDGSITLSDSETNTSVYYIPAPYMTDADGNVSHDVSYSLAELSGGTYALTVTASAEWINAQDRSFPVKIDPTVTSGASADTYIDQERPNTSFGGEDYLLVDSNKIAFIRMLQLPTLPTGAYINSAYLDVYYYLDTTSSYETIIVCAQQITRFDNYSINTTWNKAHGAGNLQMSTSEISWLGFSNSTTASETSPNLTSFNITGFVQSWYAGSPHYGIAITQYSAFNSTNITAKIKSWDSGSTYMPRYRITYTAGIEDGVYSLENLGYTEEWLTTSRNKFTLESYDSDPATSSEPFERQGLFKISNIEGTNRYVIRSMVDNRVTLNCSADIISKKYIPNIDSDVPYDDTFFIANYENGTRIIPASMPEYALSIGSYGPNIAFYEGVGYTEHWSLHRYSGPAQYGASLGNTQNIHAGFDCNIPIFAWSTDIGVHIPSAAISQNSFEKAFGLFDSENQALTFIAHYDGEVFIDISISNSTETVTYNTTAKVNVGLIIENGIYYMENDSLGEYVTLQTQSGDNEITLLDVFDNYDNDFTNDGDYREQYWYFEHDHDGYYLISSIWSGYFLSVPSAETQPTDAPLTQTPLEQKFSDRSRQFWKIHPQSTGTFMLQSKSSYVNQNFWVMASDGTTVNQVPSVTDDSNKKKYENFKFIWHLIKKEPISIVNYYDSTVKADPNLIALIDDANQFITDVIWEMYKVEVKIDGAATEYTGQGPDDCTSAVDECCNCSDDCSSHHKNTTYISDEIYANNTEDNHIYVLWCDRESNTYCNEINGIHSRVDSGIYARVHDQRPVIHIMDIPESSDYEAIKAYMATILLHEFAHTLKIGEPYKDPTHTSIGCVMCTFEGTHFENIYEWWIESKKIPFCYDCEYTINNYIYFEKFDRN